MKPRIERLGDQGLLLSLGESADAALNRDVHGIAARLRRRRPPWLVDVVPAYASLALFVDADAFPDGDDPLQRASDWLAGLLGDAACSADTDEATMITVPACYDAGFAPDLADLAAHAGMAVEDVIARHLAGDYRVAMIGFAAGFPYLLGLDPALAMPRLAKPRLRVPAGSVGIGGVQAGIYPRESPGGWRLLGRTPLRLFDPSLASPSLLQPGMRLRFARVDRGEYERLEQRR
jgi:inhibitor of KinA